MDGAEVSILKEPHNISLDRSSEGIKSLGRESDILVEFARDVSHKS